METTARPHPTSSGPHAAAAAVRLDGVSKSFGPVAAVDDLSLTVRRGETVALLGPNGAGKTTTIGMLLGLLRPDRGAVRLFGGTPDEALRAGSVGAMLQDGGMMRGARVGELLEMLGRQYADPLPVGEAARIAQLGDLLGRRVDRLSGGQAQRLRVAVALIGNPELLVLDEPTAAMDVDARRAFWRDMDAQAAAGRTILFSTHYLEEADDHCDRVVVLASGRVIADDTPARIKASVGFRVLRFSVAATEHRPDFDDLPGVTSVKVSGRRIELLSNDTDAALRALLARRPDAHDIEVNGVDLEEAFVALTTSSVAA